MNTRSTLGGGTLLGLALLFIGLTILFNHALRGWRLDLTQNRLYTTAAGTDRILASIKEPINLYFFFSAKTAKKKYRLIGSLMLARIRSTCISSSRQRPRRSCRS